MLWWSNEMQKSSVMKLPSATKEDNEEFCNNNNNKSSGRREKERKKINLRTIQVVERASERASKQRSQEAPRRQVGKISEENPFSFHPSHPLLTRHRKGRDLKGRSYTYSLIRGRDPTPINK